MKNKEELRIVYMGTPDFAVESLRALVEGGYNVVAVVTMPDKPMGRHGSVLQPSPVKQYAVEHGLKVMQPEKLKDPEFVEELRALKADLQIVVAFRMLPEIVWSMPPLGTFNAHASLLPKYRGAAPINWAVINGETETGITTFFLKHEIELLEKKNSSRSTKPTKAQIANSEIADEIYNAMEDGKSYTVTDVKAIVPALAEANPQKVTALLTKLRKEIRVSREVVKGKAFFTKI
jgi:methionyl-tRNA formyltransferase